MIHYTMWEDEHFGSLSNEAKLMFIGLISQADDEGRGKANPSYIRGRVFMYDDMSVANTLQIRNELVTKMKHFRIYSVKGYEYFCFEKWGEYQSIRKDTFKESKIPKPQNIDCESVLDDRNETVTNSLQDRNETVTPRSSSRSSSRSNTKSSSKYSETSDAYLVSKAMADKLQSLYPERKYPDLQKWSLHIDRLIRIDGKTKEQILYMIAWIHGGEVTGKSGKVHKLQMDHFWTQNILSTKKLREKFDDLIPKIKKAIIVNNGWDDSYDPSTDPFWNSNK